MSDEEFEDDRWCELCHRDISTCEIDLILVNGRWLCNNCYGGDDLVEDNSVCILDLIDKLHTVEDLLDCLSLALEGKQKLGEDNNSVLSLVQIIIEKITAINSDMDQINNG